MKTHLKDTLRMRGFLFMFPNIKQTYTSGPVKAIKEVSYKSLPMVGCSYPKSVFTATHILFDKESLLNVRSNEHIGINQTNNGNENEGVKVTITQKKSNTLAVVPV